MASNKELREIQFGMQIPTNTKSQKFPDNTVVSSKYTLVTFLPKNLFEQFRRMVNFFFLCLIVIQLSIDIPVEPIPYAIAFFFVIGVTGLKQGYEDYLRHKADNKVNFAKVNLVDDNGNIIEINSKDIKVNQIIKLRDDDPVPCDLLLVACTSESGSPQPYCQITTANLDGESNFKMRLCPLGLQSILDGDEIRPDKLKGYNLKYDSPNADLYAFDGQIFHETLHRPITVSMENVLLRGSRVKNCQSVYAIAIYTGMDTRLSMNSSKAKASKFSTIEHTMNKIVIGMFVSLLILSGISLGLGFMHRDKTFDGVWYLGENDDSNVKFGVTIFFSYLVLLCYMIPISLSVTFELQKLGCSKYFSWDKEMICPETGSKPLCNTSELNEELGQVEYLFTDKTGTLTDNDLIFKICSVNGVTYEYSELDGLLMKQEGETVPFRDLTSIDHFLEALALCHTVRVLPFRSNRKDSNAYAIQNNIEIRDDDVSTGLKYQANSLDEEVLVKVAHNLGVKFLGENEKVMTLDAFGVKRKINILATLEFDSDRKCMSVIIKDGEEFYLFCKGAESSIFPRCGTESKSLVEVTGEHVTQFATMGYRTLVVAYRKLEKSDVDEFISKAEEFRNNPAELKSLYASVERDLTLLGCTGVEDKLQPGVPETLVALRKAGIKILILTGDKLETAISVAASCGIISSSENDSNGSRKQHLHIFSNLDDSDALEKQIIQLNNSSKEIEPDKKLIVVMDGACFGTALEKCKSELRNTILKAESVIFCRMAPMQKAQVVTLVRNYSKKTYKTCAVGDGGNDCAMLREAHVGIGIMGKEGLQAARESDFAIGRFRFLEKALLVHGYWFYQRLSTLITYFFYRGVIFIFQIFLYGFDSGFSANTIFHSTFVMMFTIAFASIPVLVQGLTEQSLSQKELLENPFHYRGISGNELMSFRKTARWFIIGIWHILICYYVPKYVWMESSFLFDYGAFSLFISSLMVLIADTKILVESHYFTWSALIAQLISYGGMALFYSIVCHAGGSVQGSLAYSYIPMLQQIEFWITTLLVIILSVTPDLMLISFQNLINS